MSGASFRRATKNHAVRVDHIDGSVTEGFVPIPYGMDLVGTVTQAQHFLHFQMDSGERTLMNIASIKRLTSLEDASDEREREESAAEKARAKREAENAKRREEEERAAREAAKEAKPEKKRERYRSAEEYDALEILGLTTHATKEDIAAAYRKLVKLYHPDRLRGLGVSQRKIDFAADRLSDINGAYRVLMAAEKAA